MRQAGGAAPARPRVEPERGASPPPPSDRPVPRRQIVLRSIVLVLAILSGGVTGFLGFKAYSNVHDPSQQKTLERHRALLEVAEKAGVQRADTQDLREEIARFERLGRVCYAMLAAGVLGIAGGVLAFLRRRKVAAPLMLLPPAVAGILYAPSLIFASLLILAGLLSFLIRPWPPAERA
jgi:hypothetical protein